MVAYTPNFSVPYQSLEGTFELDPEGMVGEDGALVIDAALAGLDTRIDTTEAALTLRAAIGARTTNQSIPNATETDITLPTQEKDTTAMFTPGDAHITIPAGGGGTYTCVAWVVWAAGATGFRRIGISKNNGTTAAVDIWYVVQLNTGAAADVGQCMVKELDLVAGDTIRIKGLHNQGVAHNVSYATLSVTRKPA